MKLTVVGSGDAFGSGGRLQSCYHLEADGRELLLDCGATAIIGMQRLGLDPDRVSTIAISHLHGDHFAGLVWFLLHAHYVTGRTAPLKIVGPEGIEERFAAAAEALFPQSTKIDRRFEVTFATHAGGVARDFDGFRITPFEVSHPSGAPPYALRVEAGGKVLAFSGDTKWVDVLLKAAAGADLYISECYGYDVEGGHHMTWRDIAQNLDRLTARRVLLTHMGGGMLSHVSRVGDPRVLFAEDGLRLEV